MSRCHWVLLSLLLGPACSVGDPDAGSGPVTLSPRVEAGFQEYMARDAPLYFAITENGFGSYYSYCVGGVNCTSSAARMQVMDRCRSLNRGSDCKIYAVGRSIVWQGAEGTRPAPEFSQRERLTRDCLGGRTPPIRIQKCSEAIASDELSERDKRGPYYVRGRAYEEIGGLDLAERDYRAVLRIDPQHASAQARLDRLVAPAAAPN